MEQPTDTSIWRYLDLARYVSLLECGLFFARADAFADAWEGGFGGADLERFRADNAKLGTTELQAAWDALVAAKDSARSTIGASCWHKAEHEFARLWELYIPRGLGVAVRSTTARVLAAVAGAQRPVTPVDIEYSDYQSLSLGLDPVKLLSHKRLEFGHEREVRFLIEFRKDERASMESIRLAIADCHRVVTPWPPSPVVRVVAGTPYTTTDDTLESRTAPAGVHVKTDLKQLIERVVLAPDVAYPTRRAVIAITKAFGLDRHIIGESSVQNVSFDQVEFCQRS